MPMCLKLKARSGRLLAFATALLLTACFTGCGGASFRNGVFDDGIVRYRVAALPAGFRSIRVGDNDLAWHHDRLGTISINATCSDYEDVPEAALMNHLFFGTSERHYRLEETATLDGRGARHVIADVELDGVPVTLEIYLIKKDGCVYDLSHIASRSSFEAGLPVFTAFARGFAVLSTHLKD
jgi:hypothetical protein